jgi:hypothetical protein
MSMDDQNEPKDVTTVSSAQVASKPTKQAKSRIVSLVVRTRLKVGGGGPTQIIMDG